MIKTSLRLQNASELYKEVLIKKNEEMKNLIPSVSYPNEVLKYYLKNVEYDYVTSTISVIFEVFKYRRKIVRYEQYNYVKTPVYSKPYKIALKDKIIKIKFKSGDVSLILSNDDVLIRENYKLILLHLNNITLLPEDFQRELLDYYHKNILSNNDREIENIKKYYQSEQNKLATSMSKTINKIEVWKQYLNIAERKMNALYKKYFNIIFVKDSLLKKILTFGLMSPNNRIKRYSKKFNKLNIQKMDFIDKYDTEIQNYQKLCIDKTDLTNEERIKLNDLNYLEIVEMKQYEFDISNVSFPFYDSKAPTDPEKMIPGEYICPVKYKIEKKVYQLNEGFVEFHKRDFIKYEGLMVPGVILFKNDKNDKMIICPTNDLWYFVFIVLNDYSKYHSFWKIFGNLDKITVKVILTTTPNEVLDIYYKYCDKIELYVCC